MINNKPLKVIHICRFAISAKNM